MILEMFEKNRSIGRHHLGQLDSTIRSLSCGRQLYPMNES
jgi:hypothetical protein